ncbi:MAG: DUF998 domain-containing protein [Promethearchaeati archaeon]
MADFYQLKNSFLFLFENLTQRKKARIITFCAIIAYWTGFFTNLIIIGLTGDFNYSPFNNLISDLGSSKYSPTPFIFNFGCILSGILSFSTSLYIFRYIRYKLNKTTDHQKIFNIILYIILLSGILGDIGFIGIGTFPLDQNSDNIHFLFASFLFVGYYLSAFLIGSLVLFFELNLNKIIGLYGFYITIIIFISMIIFVSIDVEFVFGEWIAHICLTIWLYTFLYSIMKRN